MGQRAGGSGVGGEPRSQLQAEVEGRGHAGRGRSVRASFPGTVALLYLSWYFHTITLLLLGGTEWLPYGVTVLWDTDESSGC